MCNGNFWWTGCRSTHARTHSFIHTSSQSPVIAHHQKWSKCVYSHHGTQGATIDLSEMVKMMGKKTFFAFYLLVCVASKISRIGNLKNSSVRWTSMVTSPMRNRSPIEHAHLCVEGVTTSKSNHFSRRNIFNAAALATLVLQNSGLNLLMRISRKQSSGMAIDSLYIPTTAVFMTETIKFLISAMVFLTEKAESQQRCLWCPATFKLSLFVSITTNSHTNYFDYVRSQHIISAAFLLVWRCDSQIRACGRSGRKRRVRRRGSGGPLGGPDVPSRGSMARCE